MAHLHVLLMFIVLTVTLQNGALAANTSRVESCRLLLSTEGSIAIRTRWPPQLGLSIALTENSTLENMRKTLQNNDPSVTYPDILLHASVRFLRAQTELTGDEMAYLWKFAARIIRQYTPMWIAVPMESPDGANVFRGQAGPSLIITKEGRLFVGYIFDGEFSVSGGWIPKYSNKQEVPKEPYPAP